MLYVCVEKFNYFIFEFVVIDIIKKFIFLFLNFKLVYKNGWCYLF